jgi:hypothetical protein
MASLLGTPCFSHNSCASGYCLAGTCQSPRHNTPCSTHLQNCPSNHTCDEETHHCVYEFDFVHPFCRSSLDCPWEQYCQKSTRDCKPRLGAGGVCTTHSNCRWDFACVNGLCAGKCLTDDHCASDETCVRAGGPNNIKYCKKQAEPELKSGSTSYISEHQTAFTIGGAVLSVLILSLLAFLIGRRTRSKRHSAGPPELPAAAVPFAYQNYREDGAAPSPPYHAAPPRYEEANGQAHEREHDKP